MKVIPPEFVPISPEEDLVTPEREAKGDLETQRNMKGKISRAIVTDRAIIKRLVHLEWLEHHHEVYGMGFLELRLAFRSPWLERCYMALIQQWGINNSNAGEIYQNVCRGMRGRGIQVVEHALENTYEALTKYDKGLYQEHFDRLVLLMDEERERIKREKEKYGE